MKICEVNICRPSQRMDCKRNDVFHLFDTNIEDAIIIGRSSSYR